ncbi:acyltransferase [uncultured Bacteroides sp.]|uniref:acyltransferase n=1 Tax=uncultured Bacteroides sp. TaxID=162156 RepID=UPI002AAC23D5|nr:acyltransferase [uncultured Bacteroides sp.]
MNTQQLKIKLEQYPAIKHLMLNFIMHPVKTRPQWWIRLFQFTYLKRGKGSVIYRSVRKDLPPFNKFILGKYSVIEDYTCLNNAVGDITIGDYCRIGLSNTVIGPIEIGDRVNISQNVVLIGLDHVYKDIEKDLIEQGVTTSKIIIGKDTTIGANTVVLSGVTIGEHCFVGAGSVVTKDIPSYSICVGNPAKIIKQYDFDKKEWVRIKN